MFTGIIFTEGKLVSLNKKVFPELTVDMELPKAIKIGDSIAVNGACLTVIKNIGNRYTFNLSRETLKLSNFYDLMKGTLLNIELPLTLRDFISGHLVSGHLDGTVRTKSIKRGAEQSKFSFTFSKSEWKRFLVQKGSVTLNGVSLTLSELGDTFFSVEIIPHTLNTTNLKYLKVGERVNIELDLLAKYLYNQR